MKNKLLSIAGVIFVLTALAALFYVANSKKDTLPASSTILNEDLPANNIEPFYPKGFFDFSYEQDGFQKIRDTAVAGLGSTNPIRYCGVYFF